MRLKMDINESTLDDICLKLRNSDLYLGLVDNSNDILLTFIDVGNNNEYLFACKEVFSYKVIRDPYEDDFPYFVGSINVQRRNIEELVLTSGWEFSTGYLPEYAWIIGVDGGIDVEITCLELTLKIVKLTNSN
jgi:hypothetical protein